MENEHSQTFHIDAYKEASFIIQDSVNGATIELVDGIGEIFGVDMIKNKVYHFTSSFAVTSWQGCTLKLKGKRLKSYVTSRRDDIYNLHLSFEEDRRRAENNGTIGPIALIAGPTDVGKSTLSRSLLNYAAKLGRKPLYVDLDVGQSSISIPGTIGILPIDGPGDIVKGFNDNKSSIYYFGHNSPGFNLLLYFLLIKKLGETLHHRLRSSQNSMCSGVIIDTCGWVTGGGYKSIILAVKSFQVNLLCVIGDRRLYFDLKNDLPNVDAKFIPKLRGVIERNKTTRRDRRSYLIQEYFDGPQFSLKSYTFDVKFSDIQIFRISSPTCKVTFDTINDADRYISLLPVTISTDLLHYILALSYADTPEAVMLTCILGFICVTAVDMEKQILTVLSPQPSPLPRNFVLIGDVKITWE
ncbi:protein CLP1 homolog [Trichonephila clavata]|uniref:Protein CLP1 homolog n=1 Tax=Trichonephila clavata TaxID=2740835 RepID=A0A8X6JBF3_TRICU|nr:protein CLP1 homolog [Trichonephila clavata]